MEIDTSKYEYELKTFSQISSILYCPGSTKISKRQRSDAVFGIE